MNLIFYYIVNEGEKTKENEDKYFKLAEELACADKINCSFSAYTIYKNKKLKKFIAYIEKRKNLTDLMENEKKSRIILHTVEKDSQEVLKCINNGFNDEAEKYFSGRLVLIQDEANMDTMFFLYGLQGLRTHYVQAYKIEQLKKMDKWLTAIKDDKNKKFISEQMRKILTQNGLPLGSDYLPDQSKHK